ncbi:MarR family winged helix-turn-helix transcriptional regulator [Uliginosibacterium sp. H1]|uniref:MarR family winged helix-turn-helix transcriptional regulator n=1 Tax=Uliginosibacterium sp. H1 TaxID=3114757 RepID=UPI002E17CD3A|nr:MarR family transcriptional regulator [Uliginosibacterium sp. H1]
MPRGAGPEARAEAAAVDQDEEMLEHLHALMHLFKAQARDALAADGSGLGPMEARALGYIARHPGSTQQDLVEHSGRDKAQIARLVSQLDERGLVERRADENDRRCQLLQLTPAGQALQRRQRQKRRQLLERMLADFDEGERASLGTLLARMRHNAGA